MKDDNQYPKRKELRIKQYNYSSRGAYFVTICIKDRKPMLSSVINPVGVGALDDPIPQVRLTAIGRLVENFLLSSDRIAGVKIDRYVIMPDHIHAIIFLNPEEYIDQNGSSRAPTPTNEMLPHVISTFKRFCHKEIGSSVFQRGYMEHIIRDQNDYETRVKYIHENPLRWYYKKLNREEDI